MQGRHQGFGRRLQFLVVARLRRGQGIVAQALAENVGDSFSKPDLALGVAADDGDEQVVDEQLARRQPRLPLVVDQPADRIVVGSVQADADLAADDVVVKDEARRPDGAQGCCPDDLAMIDVLGIGGLESKALKIERLHQRTVPQDDGPVVDKVVIGQAVADALFMLEPAGETAQTLDFIRHSLSSQG